MFLAPNPNLQHADSSPKELFSHSLAKLRDLDIQSLFVPMQAFLGDEGKDPILDRENIGTTGCTEMQLFGLYN